MFLPILCIVVVVLFIVVIFLFYVCMMRKEKKAYRNEKKQLNLPGVPYCIKQAGLLLAERKLSHVRNYFIFQLTNIVFGLASVVFSLLGLISISVEITEQYRLNIWLPYAISFFSIIFVILALYLSPKIRVAQYVTAWKETDKVMCNLLTSLHAYILLADNLKKKAAEDNKVKEIVEAIKTGEELPPKEDETETENGKKKEKTEEENKTEETSDVSIQEEIKEGYKTLYDAAKKVADAIGDIEASITSDSE